MSDLVPYQSGCLVPSNRTAVALAYLLMPNELDYEGQAAIALTDEALWVCTPDGQHDLIHFQSIREVEVKDFRGVAYERYLGSKQVIVNPRDAWGVTVKHQGIGNFIYTLSFLTFFADGAYGWQRRLQQAIAANDRRGSEGL